MSLDELKEAWSHKLESEMPQVDPRRELERIQERARELDATVRRRDRTESLVALALLPVFAYFAVQASSLVSRAGSAILAASCILIPIRLSWARRRRPDPGMPVATFLRAELELLERQRSLLSSVAIWYLAPLGIGVILFFAGGSPSPWLTAAYASVVIVFFVALYRMNRRAAADELEPRQREIRVWITMVRDDPDGGDVP